MATNFFQKKIILYFCYIYSKMGSYISYNTKKKKLRLYLGQFRFNAYFFFFFGPWRLLFAIVRSELSVITGCLSEHTNSALICSKVLEATPLGSLQNKWRLFSVPQCCLYCFRWNHQLIGPILSSLGFLNFKIIRGHHFNENMWNAPKS